MPHPQACPHTTPGHCPPVPSTVPVPVLVAVTAPAGWGTGRGLLAGAGVVPSSGTSAPSARWLWTGGFPSWWCPGQQAQHCTVLPGRSGHGSPVAPVLVLYWDKKWCPIVPVQSSQGLPVAPVLVLYWDKPVPSAPGPEQLRTPGNFGAGAVLGQTGAQCSQYRAIKDSR